MGAKAYPVIEKYIDRLSDGAIVEIGSSGAVADHGSTEFLYNVAKRTGRPFYTVDMDPETCAEARTICGDRAHLASGQKFLAYVRYPIAFLYLDNADWLWEPKQIPEWQWLIDRYDQLGAEMTNLQSQAVHLEQMIHALHRMDDSCIVLLDDTWATDDGALRRFDGKGGAVVPYLIVHGFKLHEEYLHPNPHRSAVYLTRGL